MGLPPRLNWLYGLVNASQEDGSGLSFAVFVEPELGHHWRRAIVRIRNWICGGDWEIMVCQFHAIWPVLSTNINDSFPLITILQ
jgi:hypothetical protein